MSAGCQSRTVSARQLWPEVEFIGCTDIAINSVSRHSRVLQPGQTFVALRGSHCDGHRHVLEAMQHGAGAVIAEAATEGLSIPQCIVRDTREAYGVLCQALAGKPASQLKVTGITGTNGKTTTAYLVKSILETAGRRTGLVGTIQHFDGLTSFPATLTTPTADVLAQLMQRMVQAGCSHAVMEVSSHALHQRRVAGIGFELAVFTNLAHDHLDYHGDRASYREAKGRLFQSLAPDACAVLNADDPATENYASNCNARVIRYAVQHAGDITVADVHGNMQGSRCRIVTEGGGGELRTSLPGLHNLYNCLAAAAAGWQLGLSWETIASGIEQVQEIPGRLQPVRCGQPFDVLLDYAHTAEALAVVLQSLRGMVPGRLLCLFGAGGDRDRSKRPEMARVAETYADLVVVTSDNPRTEDPQRIIRDIVDGFNQGHAVAVEPDRRAAIHLVLRVARPGDCVLIAGKGHERYQIVGKQRIPFDDRTVASEVLRQSASSAKARWEWKVSQPA